MSSFLDYAWEILSKVVYNIAAVLSSIVNLFITGWADYFNIFITYFNNADIVGKIFMALLFAVMVAIPVLTVVLLVRRVKINAELGRKDKGNKALYREIGRLNKQVLDLVEEKNKLLALKVNAMGANGQIPYNGAAALAGDAPVVAAEGSVKKKDEEMGQDELPDDDTVTDEERRDWALANRFPKLSLVDLKYRSYQVPEWNEEITLQQFVEGYRNYACSQHGLYYTPEIVRRYVAGMAASKLLILEGISGTGKTSLPYSFSRYLDNPAAIVSVQPSYRDRTEVVGFFNEFSKRFNETEFLSAVYEAGYRRDPSTLVLDEVNLARIEYYFAEVLSILEMPQHDEWLLDLVPTAWKGDPKLLYEGKILIPDSIWFVGTANNDDSTFTITDKVYDRAIPIELNERADAFEAPEQGPVHVTSEHLQYLFEKAKEENPITEGALENLNKLDQYLQTRFKLAFGNRIMKQMNDFVPVYIGSGGTELGAMDYIICRKVLKKFESMNVGYVRDEITGLIDYLEKTFGAGAMPDSVSYLQRIQNLF